MIDLYFFKLNIKNKNKENKIYINKYFDKKPKAEKIPNKIQLIIIIIVDTFPEKIDTHAPKW